VAEDDDGRERIVSETATTTVLCNREMLDLLAPIEHSKPVSDSNVTWRGDTYVAVYDDAALRALADARIEGVGAWWRWTAGLTIDIPFDPDEIIAYGGIWSYLCDVHGVSTERHLAGAISEMADAAGMRQIELMNWLAENTPQRPAGPDGGRS
jgi:hypothetical protein